MRRCSWALIVHGLLCSWALIVHGDLCSWPPTVMVTYVHGGLFDLEQLHWCILLVYVMYCFEFTMYLLFGIIIICKTFIFLETYIF